MPSLRDEIEELLFDKFGFTKVDVKDNWQAARLFECATALKKLFEKRIKPLKKIEPIFKFKLGTSGDTAFLSMKEYNDTCEAIKSVIGGGSDAK